MPDDNFPFLPPGAPEPRPGDLVGFSGADILADLINLGSLGIPRRGLSHVAIVAEHTAGLAVYESTTTVSLPCLINEEPVDGVQCHLIADRVIGYAGRVWHYPLRRPLSLRESLDLSIDLAQTCRCRRPYDYMGAFDSRSTLIGLAMRAKFGRENLTKLFCSELGADKWRRAHILHTKNASRWSPNALARYAVRHGLTWEPIEWLTATDTQLPAEEPPTAQHRRA